jgi:hypothetical protein
MNLIIGDAPQLLWIGRIDCLIFSRSSRRGSLKAVSSASDKKQYLNLRAHACCRQHFTAKPDSPIRFLGALAPSFSPKAIGGWAYGAATPEQDLLLLYFEKDCPQAAVTGAKPNARYTGRWFDPRNGKWTNVDGALISDTSGRIALPPFPNQTAGSDVDWALKLTLAGNR